LTDLLFKILDKHGTRKRTDGGGLPNPTAARLLVLGSMSSASLGVWTRKITIFKFGIEHREKKS